MEILLLFLRLGLAMIPISSAYTKLRDLANHELSIQNYQIIPDRYAKPAAKFDAIVEMMVGLLLLVGLFYKVSLVLFIGLIVVYSLAILINLIRGRTTLSCGCGGIVGEKPISWKLIFRNLAISIVAVWLLFSATKVGILDYLFTSTLNEVYPPLYFIASLYFGLITVTIFVLIEIKKINHHFNRLLHRGEI
ncbi:MauE/DoxX family redox-associated membrane protein [Guptibacillus hwajinpoensis]|nr:MauE/DoxX family redox-associated membrane protein [Pseudalkalibacillus hwajinpoensis]